MKAKRVEQVRRYKGQRGGGWSDKEQGADRKRKQKAHKPTQTRREVPSATVAAFWRWHSPPPPPPPPRPPPVPLYSEVFFDGSTCTRTESPPPPILTSITSTPSLFMPSPLFSHPSLKLSDFPPYQPPVFPPSPEEKSSESTPTRLSFPDKSNHAACARFRLRRKARQAFVSPRPPALSSASYPEEPLRLVTLEHQLHDLQARIERLDHSLKLLTLPLSLPSDLPSARAESSPAVTNKAPQCLTPPSFPVPSSRFSPSVAFVALAHTCSSSFTATRKTLAAARHLPLSQPLCVLFACLALVGWWRVMFQHSKDVPTVLRIDADVIETLTIEELSRFLLSLGFDPSPVYLPYDRDEYEVDIAAVTY